MDFDPHILMLEEVSANDIEIEVDTSDTCILQDALSDHDYYLTEAKNSKKSSIFPYNVKITQLKALYHCKICGYATLKKDLMDEHSQMHKPKEKPKPKKQYIPCPTCNVKKPPEKYEKCTKCSFFTKKKASLKIHMRIHSEAKPYKCTLCDHRGETLRQLITHYEDAHRTFQKFRCHKCDFSTHMKTALKYHRLSHGQPLSCGACDFTTLQSSDMNCHMRNHVVKLNKVNT